MKSDEIQALVFGALGGCSWEYDLDRDRPVYSEEFFEMIGYGPGELDIDTGWVADNIHPEDLPQWRDAFLRSVKGESRYFDCELRFRHRDGHYFWIQTRGVVTERDRRGRAIRIVGLVFDISERKSAKESESRYRLLLDNVPDAISLKDRDGRYLYINRRFASWLDKPAHAIYGQTADEIFHPEADTLDQLRDHERRVWELGETVSEERQFPLTRDGKVRRALITKFPIYDEAGNILAIGTTNTDVTERFNTQQALRQSEQRYRQLFESAPVILIESDWTRGRKLVDRLRRRGVVDLRRHLHEHPELLRGRGDVMELLHINREALHLFRAADERGLRAHLQRDLDAAQREALIEDLCTFAAGKRRSSVHARGSRVDGEAFPAIRDSELHGVDAQDWSLVLITIRDTSAEEAVRLSEMRYRRLFESAPVALYESDWSRGKALVDELRRQGIEDLDTYFERHPQLLRRRDEVLQIIDLNREALQTYGAPNKTALIEKIEGPVIEDQRESLKQTLVTFAAGRRRASVRGLSLRFGGEVFPIVRNTELISSDREDWSRVLSSIHDLTEEVETANRLREYQQELRLLAGKISAAEESERRRISSDLHDGTIQNLVLARIQLAGLKNSLQAAPARELADSINQLLEDSLAETRSLIFEISPPVLYELGLEPAVEWLAEHYKQRTGVRVSISSDEQQVRLSQDMNVVMFQAARELLVNIAKHARAQQVSIEWRHRKDRVVLSIVDDGIGFDVDGTEVKKATDGGFGLFALRERLKLMGADFELESSPRGTRATISAPLEIDRKIA